MSRALSALLLVVLIGCDSPIEPPARPPSGLAEFFYQNNDNMGLRWKNGSRSPTEIMLSLDGVNFRILQTVDAGVDSLALGYWCHALAAAAWSIQHTSRSEVVYLRGSTSARVHVPMINGSCPR